MNEDSLRDMYDRITTHTDPHSPYYDGPAPDTDDYDAALEEQWDTGESHE
jgi:hypothetical protein